MKNKILVYLLTLLVMGVLVSEADAQRKKAKRKTRRSVPTQPVQTLEPVVISRAEDEQNGTTVQIDPVTGKPIKIRRNVTQTAAPVTNDDGELTNEVNRLNSKVKSLENKENGVTNLKELSAAEERAVNLRGQLDQTLTRENDLRTRIEQLDYQMRPEVINMETATIGSLRPEEVRENRRKSLESERRRAADQLTQSETARVRLESAIANADALVERLRARVEADNIKPAPTTEPDNNRPLAKVI